MRTAVAMLVPGLRPARLVEPALLIYVLMFSVSLIQMDRIYLDKVCQVNVKRCNSPMEWY